MVTWNAHGLNTGTAVSFSTSGALPPGIVAGTTYYVVNPATNTFNLATTANGAAISTAASSSTVTITIATPAVVTWTAHGLAAGAGVVFSTTGALPTGITAGTAYYVVNPAANTFQIAATPGGAAINTSGTQSGTQTCTTAQAGTQTCIPAYDLGDAVAYGGVNYYCIAANTNQAPPNAAYWYAMPANGDYEIPNPYAAADLMDIHYTQSADVMTLVHPSYPMMELRRYGATIWELMAINFAPLIKPPLGTISAGSPTSHQYVVTSIVTHSSRRGKGHISVSMESTVSASATCSCDLTQLGAYNTVTWSPALNAASYNVYKLIGGVYCYLGNSNGTAFTDTNSVTAAANTLKQPYPYASFMYPAAPPATVTATAYPSAIGTLNALPTGSGSTSYSYVVTALDSSSNESYLSSVATCTNNLATSGNYNTINWPSVENAQRYNVYKSSYGVYGFIGQTASLTFVDNNITADISRTPPMPHDNQLAGPNDYPAAVAYYQQRRLFAGTNNQPQNVWATRSGTESDMSYTIPVRDDSRIAFKIAARDASSIRHIVALQDLLFFSASCEWKCSSTTGVLTPTTINVQPQSYIGANNATPVVVGNAALYAAARGGHIRQINYNWQINGYQTTDSSIFAPHLFDYNTINDMAYSRGPIPILWCVSSSGKLLGMTYLPEQQIAAWHQHATGNGDAFESICTISENNEDMLYAVVRRTINGATKRYVERLHTRLYNTLTDCHYVDCGTTYTAPVKNGTFSLSGNTLSCSMTAHGFTSGQTCWFSFSDSTYGALPGGMGYTVTVVDANTFTLTVATAGATSGTLTWLPNVLTGLTWLEGMAVNILADGAVLPQQTVTGGTVTFPVGVSTAHIGLPITAQLQTPPASAQVDTSMAQGLAKNINKAYLRTYRSSGILAGPDFSHLVPYRQRTTENPGSPPNLVSDEIEIVLDNSWGMGGQICIQQSDPLPLDIASMTLEIAVGGGV